MKCYNCREQGAKKKYKIYDARDLYFRMHFVCKYCFNKAVNHEIDFIQIIKDVE